MTLLFVADHAPFSCGSCSYTAKPASVTDTLVRPFLFVSVEQQPLEVAIDTGGFFLIIKPQIGELLGLRPEDALSDTRLIVRGERHDGHLHRVTLTLEADHGESCKIEVSAFVPADYSYEYPNFIGWSECLERFRFAFEPSQTEPGGQFHFGPLDL